MIDILILTVLSSLAVWRLTYMAQRESGPWEIFYKIRAANIEYKHPFTTAKGILGELLICHYCGSVWVAAPFGVLAGLYANLHSGEGVIMSGFIGILTWLCSSAGSIFVELQRRMMDEQN